MTYPPQGSGGVAQDIDPCVEEFSSHFGVADAFWATSTTGNSTAVHETTANHFINQSVGIGAAGYSRLYSVKDYTIGTQTFTVNLSIRATVVGVGGVRKTCIGLKDSTVAASLINAIMFYCDSAGQWSTVTAGAAANTTNNIAAISDGDLLTIECDANEARFYVNCVLVETHTTNIPAVALHTLGLVIAEDADVTTTRVLQVDMLKWTSVP